jgi:hypothetical protein
MMHIETQFDLVKAVRIHQVSGVVNLSEFEEGLRALYASPKFNPDLNALWDVRQADFGNVSPNDVRSLMQMVASHWGKDGKCRAAIVVAGMAEYGISRMYESQFGPAAPCKIKVFMDIELAWKWFAASEEIVKGMASRPLAK